MKLEEFERILRTFVDFSSGFEISPGRIVAQIRDELIDVKLIIQDNQLYVLEEGDDKPYEAEKWLIIRVARLPSLADRILEYIRPEDSFITPPGLFESDYFKSEGYDTTSESNSINIIQKVLSNSIPGATSVLYLISGAGEGKTTLINYIANLQAYKYKNKESDWILLPIPLGGRTLLRIDDIAMGVLMNKFKFPMLYFDSLVELIRMGVIVPALDGFEEMMVETTDESLFSVANLMNRLNSSGRLLISARKAFYDFSRSNVKAKFFDAIKKESIIFSKLNLELWEKKQFVDYLHKRKINNPEDIHNKIVSQLNSDNHPVLRRAFLVKSLVDLFADNLEIDTIISELDTSSTDFFDKFIISILQREVYKWTDKSGDEAGGNLLNLGEHIELLSILADEMWTQNSDFLRIDVIEQLAEIFSESKHFSPKITIQIRERIKNHALLIPMDHRNKLFSFEHEEIKNHFLGKVLAEYLLKKDEVSLITMIKKASIPIYALNTCAQHIKKSANNIEEYIQFIMSISRKDVLASYTRENSGLLIIMLLDSYLVKDLKITEILFPVDCLRSRELTNIEFNNSVFQSNTLEHTKLENVQFVNVSFENIKLCGTTKFNNVTFYNVRIESLTSEADDYIFNPDQIKKIIKDIGGIWQEDKLELEGDIPEEEDNKEIKDLQRIFKAFYVKTYITENVLKLKTSSIGKPVLDEYLKNLIRIGAIEEVQYIGAGSQRRYRLKLNMEYIDQCFKKSKGNVEKFYDCIEHKKK